MPHNFPNGKMPQIMGLNPEPSDYKPRIVHMKPQNYATSNSLFISSYIYFYII